MNSLNFYTGSNPTLKKDPNSSSITLCFPFLERRTKKPVPKSVMFSLTYKVHLSTVIISDLIEQKQTRLSATFQQEIFRELLSFLL